MVPKMMSFDSHQKQTMMVMYAPVLLFASTVLAGMLGSPQSIGLVPTDEFYGATGQEGET